MEGNHSNSSDSGVRSDLRIFLHNLVSVVEKLTTESSITVISGKQEDTHISNSRLNSDAKARSHERLLLRLSADNMTGDDTRHCKHMRAVCHGKLELGFTLCNNIVEFHRVRLPYR